MDAIRLGLDIQGEGYNLYLFVLGDAGSGRHEIVTRLLEDERHEGPPPLDWCYVWNFDDASHPRLLRLPCGRGPNSPTYVRTSTTCSRTSSPAASRCPS